MTDNMYIKNGKPNEEAIYRDAWRVADPGAVNPVAVARTLAAASSALLHDIGTDGVRKHPALRVMAGQLAMLYNVSSIGAELEDYDRVKSVVDSLKPRCELDGTILDEYGNCPQGHEASDA